MDALAGKRVLLIEDDISIALIVKGLLFGRPYHYQVERAESLASGLNKLAANETDLIILDLNLPDSSGLETFHCLRAYAPQVAIVILTSEESEENAFRALQDGAQDYLYKWELKERSLLRSVTYAIERKQAELALRESRDRLEEQVQERTGELQSALRQSQAA
jgi:DNA-binding response OmpR family regulator